MGHGCKRVLMDVQKATEMQLIEKRGEARQYAAAKSSDYIAI